MIRKLYDWVIELAESRYALWALAVVAFAESSFFPIPPDALMIPMILATPHRAFRIAAIATVSSVLGGMFGYWIGAVLFEQIGLPVLQFYGKTDNFITFQESYAEWGAWAVLIAGVTPFPYKVITILSGSASLNLMVFTIASICARGIRFFLVAALLWKFGPAVREFIEKRLGLVASVAFALLILGFAALKFL